jgi:sugar lactone lactonase YvrE
MRFLLTDFTDKKKLLEWLNYDGNPPKAAVRVGASGYGTRVYQASRIEEKPVTDESTLEIWWSDYRANRAVEWQKSPANPYKPQTHKQFLADCLRSLGIKGGTVEERIKKAIATHPALYSQSVAA